MNKIIKRVWFTLSCTLIALYSFAQFSETQFTIATVSPKCAIIQRIGITDVEIRYHSPAVRGREIWNSFYVPYDGKPFPWRAGANENTTISFSKDVSLNGNKLAAGVYGFHIIPSASEWILAFSKNSSSWGSFTYKIEEDALRIKVKPDSIPHQEWLRYEFLEPKQSSKTSSAVVALSWEKKRVSFKIEDDTKQHVLETIKSELRSVKQYSWDSWYLAASYCVQKKIYLEEGLEWINKSISLSANFSNTNKKAELLELTDKKEEAKKIRELAMQLITPAELLQQGWQLLFAKKPKEAMELFQLNLKRNGDKLLPVTEGLARGYAASGDLKQSLKYARLSMVNSIDDKSKGYWEKAIKALEGGKDFTTISISNIDN